MSPQIYHILQTDILWLTFPLFIITASTPLPPPSLIAQSWEWATLCFAEPQRVHVPLTWFPSWSFAIFLSHYKLKEGWASLTLLIFRCWELMVGAEAAESPRRMWTVFLWFFFFYNRGRSHPMTSQLEEKTEIKGLCLICLRGPMRIDERRMCHTSLSFLPLLQQLCSVTGGVIGNRSLSVRVVGGVLLSSQTSLPPLFFFFKTPR